MYGVIDIKAPALNSSGVRRSVPLDSDDRQDSGYVDGICLLCPIGTYAEFDGQLQCTHCGVGMFLNANGSVSSSDCQYCEQGHASNATAAASCEPCTAGTYQYYRGQKRCKPCQDQLVSGAGAKECARCPYGQEYVNATTCRACGGDTFTSPFFGVLSYPATKDELRHYFDWPGERRGLTARNASQYWDKVYNLELAADVTDIDYDNTDQYFYEYNAVAPFLISEHVPGSTHLGRWTHYGNKDFYYHEEDFNVTTQHNETRGREIHIIPPLSLQKVVDPHEMLMHSANMDSFGPRNMGPLWYHPATAGIIEPKDVFKWYGYAYQGDLDPYDTHPEIQGPFKQSDWSFSQCWPCQNGTLFDAYGTKNRMHLMMEVNAKDSTLYSHLDYPESASETGIRNPVCVNLKTTLQTIWENYSCNQAIERYRYGATCPGLSTEVADQVDDLNTQCFESISGDPDVSEWLKLDYARVKSYFSDFEEPMSPENWWKHTAYGRWFNNVNDRYLAYMNAPYLWGIDDGVTHFVNLDYCCESPQKQLICMPMIEFNGTHYLTQQFYNSRHGESWPATKLPVQKNTYQYYVIPPEYAAAHFKIMKEKCPIKTNVQIRNSGGESFWPGNKSPEPAACTPCPNGKRPGAEQWEC